MGRPGTAKRTTSRLVAVLLGASVACAGPSAVERARSLVRQHREEEAAAVLRARLRSRPEDTDARRLLVRVLALDGDFPAARVEVDELAARSPAGDPMPFLELGHALELAHRYDEALAAYDAAAAAAPSSPDGPLEGGRRAARWGEAESAEPRLKEAIRRGAGDADTWHTLGLVRVKLGDLAGAEEAYRAGVAADARAPESWLGLATVAVVRQDAAAALVAYAQVLARRPRFAGAELGRAWALARLGRAAEASQALDRAVALGAPAENVARQRADLRAVVDGGAD